LYSGLQKVVKDPHAMIDLAYAPIAQLPWLQQLANDISLFDATFLGFIDLSRPALSDAGLYLPGLALVIGSAIAQFKQSSQLMPRDKDARSLRAILKDAGNGKQADQAEINAAIGQSTRYIIPFAILFFTLGIASALNLYWFVGGVIAYIQQSRVLKQDETELEAVADATEKPVIEGEVVEKKSSKKPTQKKKKPSQNKRRKR
jgi:membrane protein insertase Oxa1/YidC/SpoIIIJ